MPLRTISTDLSAHIAKIAQTVALCVKVTRLDGVILGFTSCDRALVVDNGDGTSTTYQASTSFDPSAISQQAGQGVDNLEIIGLLQSATISDADIRAGKYDGAKVEMFLLNYLSPGAGRLQLLTGTLGEFTFQTGQFTVEVRSLTQQLQQSIGELTSPLCRVAHLGDARCKVVLAPFRYAHVVAAVDSVWQFRFADTSATNWFTYGKIEVTSGANAGFTREIKSSTLVTGGTQQQIILAEPFPYALANGDAFTAEAGCDRQYATCRDKFSNLVNFRGEPFVPGNDQIIRRGRK